MQTQSLLQNSTPLNFLPKKHQLFLPIILLLNSIKITFPSFYYFSIIFQHIPLLIISIDLQINKTSSQKQLSNIIRYFSSYKLQNKKPLRLIVMIHLKGNLYFCKFYQIYCYLVKYLIKI